MSLFSTWIKEDFYSTAVPVIVRYSGNASNELAKRVQFVSAVVNGVSHLLIFDGLLTLIRCFSEYLGSGNLKLQMKYPLFDVQLLKRCLQKTVAFVVFANLDTFSMI